MIQNGEEFEILVNYGEILDNKEFKEGEIVKISNIKIPKKFQKPSYNKMKRRQEYFEKHGYFRSTIILNDKNYLVDGYTTYLLTKRKGFDYITILREE